MIYEEYLECARKHLISCQQLLECLTENTDNKEAYLDIWYLSGYIIEGFTVYSAYKINNWNPPTKEKDIKSKYDIGFSERTHLDYFRCRLCPKTNIPVFSKGLINYSVQGHNYQSIIQGLLSTSPTFKGFPIMGDGTVDKDVKTLIDSWKPDIRYWYKAEEMKNIPTLTVDLLKRLIETCNNIYKKMITV